MFCKEEIKIQARLYSPNNIGVQGAFEVSAKWADRTMIDKACEWLRVALDKEEERHYVHVHGFDKERREIFLEDFRKAMKGEEI